MGCLSLHLSRDFLPGLLFESLQSAMRYSRHLFRLLRVLNAFRAALPQGRCNNPETAFTMPVALAKDAVRQLCGQGGSRLSKDPFLVHSPSPRE